uniref:Uncharacterized protein n=1 Tax=Timema genevievae TaxID=629358 RepID=A0A7R9JRM4_TIMGE|nr:unnamed protein product [Timema genevievae]
MSAGMLFVICVPSSDRELKLKEKVINKRLGSHGDEVISKNSFFISKSEDNLPSNRASLNVSSTQISRSADNAFFTSEKPCSEFVDFSKNSGDVFLPDIECDEAYRPPPSSERSKSSGDENQDINSEFSKLSRIKPSFTSETELPSNGIQEKSMQEALKELLSKQKIENAVWCDGSQGDYIQVSFAMSPGEQCEELLRQLSECGIGRRLNSVISVLPCSLCYREEVDADATICSPRSAKMMDDRTTERKEHAKNTAWNKFVTSVRARLTVAQVVEGVKANASLTFDFLVLLLVASLVSALGLAYDSTVILVSSMLFSPLIGPVMAGTFGTVIGDRSLQKMGVLNELFGLGISLVVGFLYGIFMGLTGQGDWPTMEMTSRGEFQGLWVGAVVAIASGAAVSIAILGDNTSSLVGVAISVSLLPTAVNAVNLSPNIGPILQRWFDEVASSSFLPQHTAFRYKLKGLLWALACVDLAWPTGTGNSTQPHVYSENRPVELALLGAISLCLTIINIVFIFLAGILFLKLANAPVVLSSTAEDGEIEVRISIKEVAPRTSKAQRHFWDHDVKIARDYNRTMRGPDARNLGKSLANELAAMRQEHLGTTFSSAQGDLTRRRQRSLSVNIYQQEMLNPHLIDLRMPDNQQTWSPGTGEEFFAEKTSVRVLESLYRTLTGAGPPVSPRSSSHWPLGWYTLFSRATINIAMEQFHVFIHSAMSRARRVIILIATRDENCDLWFRATRRSSGAGTMAFWGPSFLIIRALLSCSVHRESAQGSEPLARRGNAIAPDYSRVCFRDEPKVYGHTCARPADPDTPFFHRNLI